VFIITLVFYTIIALGIYFLPTGIACTGTPSRRGDLRAQHSAGLDADRLGRGPRLGAHQFRRWPNPDHPRRGLVSLVHESDPAPLFCAGMPQITNRRLSLADRRVQTKGKVEAMLKFVAAPISRNADGAVVIDPDQAVECRSAGAAIETARQMSLLPQYIGSFAFCRSGDQTTGRYQPIQVLRRFGDLESSMTFHD
jgi:hypothetical protein